MKKITEYTEKEILELSQDDISMIIKLAKAEAGIKFIEYPTRPIYHEIPKANIETFSCNLFGNVLSFSDYNELKSLIDFVTTLKTRCSIDSDYSLNNAKWITKELKTVGYHSSQPWDKIESDKVYSFNEFTEVKSRIRENLKSKEDYDNKLKEYRENESLSKDIVSEIYDRINEVVNKYDDLKSLCRKFKNDYLPLSGDNEEIAINFLDKAYSLTDEQKTYILENYQSNKTL